MNELSGVLPVFLEDVMWFGVDHPFMGVCVLGAVAFYQFWSNKLNTKIRENGLTR